MDNIKEQQRAELHKTIWAMANELRGAVDGWDFKMYVLGFMFYRFISEDFTNYINKNENESGIADFNYELMSDEDALAGREEMISSKGYFILPSELFSNVVKRAAKDENLNVTLGNIFKHIEESSKGTRAEKDFKGLFNDIDLNNQGKLGITVADRNRRLVKILESVASMNLGGVDKHSIDAFGDAYEYLMAMYASNAGKSGGEFYTPQEVSKLLSRLAIMDKKQVNKVYDYACGSASLLLQSAKLLGKDNVKIGFYGQEINPTTYNLARINMFLHGIEYDKFDIECADTLTDPRHWDDEPFEVIVSNPPYSIKWIGDDDTTLINDDRFSPAAVLAPKGKADWAFLMHALAWLSSNGVAANVVFPGILYRGGAEQKIRKYMVDNNYVDTVIQLPDNLFFGTSIATCILVLKRDLHIDHNIRFIDASKHCVKVTNSNKLTEQNINDIYNLYMDRNTDYQYEAKTVSYEEIVKNNYNLSVSTYVEKEDTREKVDIDVLNEKIDSIVKRENKLRIEIAKIVREIEGNGTNELCIDTDFSYKQYSKAILECPCGYHIEYTRSKYIIYVQDGYYYDIDTDLCIEEGVNND